MLIKKSTGLLRTFSLLVLASLSFVSCEKEAEDDKYIIKPSEEGYFFDNVSIPWAYHQGMLSEMMFYMDTIVNSEQAPSQATLLAMLENSYVWQSEFFSLAQPPLNVGFDDQLSDESVNYIKILIEDFVLAQTTIGINGGALSSNDGSVTYVFDENGYEPSELIESLILGEFFYHDATSYFLSDVEDFRGMGANVENEVGDSYITAMQSNWDSAFGYLSAPTQMSKTNARTLDLTYFAKDMLIADEAGFPVINNILDLGFYRGREAINNKNYDLRDKAITVITREWEFIYVSKALHNLNNALDNYDDFALRNHQLSTAFGCIRSLEFNDEKSISDAQIATLLGQFGNNLYQINAATIDNIRNELADVFGLTATDF